MGLILQLNFALLFLPLDVMSCAKDPNESYLLILFAMVLQNNTDFVFTITNSFIDTKML